MASDEGAQPKFTSYGSFLGSTGASAYTKLTQDVLDLETKCVEARRFRRYGKAAPVKVTGTMRHCTGLALSGGGIRSAAFCLGAIQALHDAGLLSRVDYLSTVSGGGYIGSSLTCAQDAAEGVFPFKASAPNKERSTPLADKGASAGASDRRDSLAVGHIRNYANYLIPNGLRDLVSDVSVIARGLAANLLIIACVILVLAGLTLWANPDRSHLDRPDLLGWETFPYHPQALSSAEENELNRQRAELSALARNLAPLKAVADGKTATVAELREKQALEEEIRRKSEALTPLLRKAEPTDFYFTKLFLVVAIAVHVLWALGRFFAGDGASEFRGAGILLSRVSLAVLLLSGFLEIQPYALRGLYDLYVSQGSTNWIGRISQLAAIVTPYLAPFAAFSALVGKVFGDALKTRQGETGWPAILARVVSRAVPVFVALVLPLTIWVVYLHVTIAGDIGFIYRPASMRSLLEWRCGKPDIGSLIGQDTSGACNDPGLIRTHYLWLGVLGFLLTWLFLTPNGNSLHRLYRDRLSKAFLFDPTKLLDARTSASARADLEPRDGVRLTDLHIEHGPIHLINAALNIQGSKYANQRGRNADFFQFSPLYCGSMSTGYIRTDVLEDARSCPDLATAMAISGAAASSNMGSNTVWGFAPTLALLNIRLGYWMINPKHVPQKMQGRQAGLSSWVGRGLLDLVKPYLLLEMTSSLHEDSGQIYLTDGGHIENLGLYELLRRRCSVIVVIDAEADPNLSFGSLVELERYARIDLGVRIDLPWRRIQAGSLAVNKEYADGVPSKPPAARRTHMVVGTIDYGQGETGRIAYIKSSLTGDENDYIRDYKRRNPAFPHETTGDQFFSEEQFECYRALGFHAVRESSKSKRGGLSLAALLR